MSRTSGFTLLEIILAIIIITTGVVMLIRAMSAMIRGSTDIENIDITTSLARDMMDEILGKGFDDPDQPGSFGREENRRNKFDDVDDYDGWRKNPPEDVDGNRYDGKKGRPNYTRFTRSVIVENVPEDDFNTPTPPGDGTTGAKRIIVNVSWRPTGGVSEVKLRSVVTEYHPDPR